MPSRYLEKLRSVVTDFPWQRAEGSIEVSRSNEPESQHTLIPREVAPAATAVSAYSICSSFPEGENVVRENEYAESPILPCDLPYVQAVDQQTLTGNDGSPRLVLVRQYGKDNVV